MLVIYGTNFKPQTNILQSHGFTPFRSPWSEVHHLNFNLTVKKASRDKFFLRIHGDFPEFYYLLAISIIFF